MEQNKKAKLSRGVLDMKFMKKTRERVQKEEEEAEGQAMYSQEITEDMKKSGNTIFIDASIMVCRDLCEGRLSFGGMNPEIERIMDETYNKKMGEAEKLKEKDITDVEMAKGYSSLVDTMGKKFQQQKGQKGGKKFVKPQAW